MKLFLILPKWPDGSLWVAGIFALAHFSDGSWTEYPIRARRLLIAPDGSVWAEGWDGKLDSGCCFVHLSAGEWSTYTHDAVLPVDDELYARIEALLP